MALAPYYPATANKIVHQVNVDLVNRAVLSQPIHIVQGDINLPIVEVSLYKNDIPYVIPDGMDGNVRFEKPNPSPYCVYNPLLGYNFDRTAVYFEISRQMTTNFGKAYAIIELTSGAADRVGSSPILINIQRDPIQPGDIEDTNEYETLREFVAEAEDAAARADESESKAAQSASDAETFKNQAAQSASDAETFKNQAAQSEDNCVLIEEQVAGYATSAGESAAESRNSKIESENFSKLSQSYAVGGTGVRPDEDIDCSEYYYEKTKEIVGGLSGGFVPMGTIRFEELESQMKVIGHMYNISDEFTSDDGFKDGPGRQYPAGTNVYYTADGYWDALAGPPQVLSVNKQTGDVMIDSVPKVLTDEPPYLATLSCGYTELGGNTPKIHLANHTYQSEELDIYPQDGVPVFLTTTWNEEKKDYDVKIFNLLDFTHPIGSYYLSNDPTSPAELFGGTWARIKDRFILAAGDTYTIGDAGGSVTNTITIDNMPPHDHGNRGAGRTYVYYGNGNTHNLYLSSTFDGDAGIPEYSGSHKYVVSQGSGQELNNMPPYTVAYCWLRTA